MLKSGKCSKLFMFCGLILVAIESQAELVRFNFAGQIAVSSGYYAAGETFTGFYILDSEIVGRQKTTRYSSGDWITSVEYYNAVVAFEMYFVDKTIHFNPDGLLESGGYDSIVSVRNDQRFTDYFGDYYYSDRLITTIRDQQASIGDVDFVQFDWNESSFAGMPQLLTSSELPLVATNYSVTTHQGRIAADGNQNIHFTLSMLEVVNVPLPPTIWLFGPALAGLAVLRRRKTGTD